MKELLISPTEVTPEVCFKPIDNKFFIEGISMPEDAVHFFEPILEWLNEYAQKPDNHVTFNIKLHYFNTGSSKQLIKIFKVLEEIAKKSTLVLKWHYSDVDEEMEALGEEYAEVLHLKMELIEYKDEGAYL